MIDDDRASLSIFLVTFLKINPVRIDLSLPKHIKFGGKYHIYTYTHHTYDKTRGFSLVPLVFVLAKKLIC